VSDEKSIDTKKRGGYKQKMILYILRMEKIKCSRCGENKI